MYFQASAEHIGAIAQINNKRAKYIKFILMYFQASAEHIGALAQINNKRAKYIKFF